VGEGEEEMVAAVSGSGRGEGAGRGQGAARLAGCPAGVVRGSAVRGARGHQAAAGCRRRGS
jgi:hypothetical protein